jgi:hypothetical protein
MKAERELLQSTEHIRETRALLTSITSQVEATTPYGTNTQPLTKNAADRVFANQ